MVLVECITHSSVFMWMFSAQMVVEVGYHSELQRRTKCSYHPRKRLLHEVHSQAQTQHQVFEMKSDEGTSTKVCQVVGVQDALQPDNAPGEHTIATTLPKPPPKPRSRKLTWRKRPIEIMLFLGDMISFLVTSSAQRKNNDCWPHLKSWKPASNRVTQNECKSIQAFKWFILIAEPRPTGRITMREQCQCMPSFSDLFV